MKWRSDHDTYSVSFDALGLGDQFPNRQKDGYDFSLVIPNDSDDNFRAYGTPMAPGKTGSVDCTIDKSGNVKVEGKNLKVSIDGPVKVDAQSLEVSSSGEVKVSATGSVAVKGSGPMSIEASGAVKLKGANVGIN